MAMPKPALRMPLIIAGSRPLPCSDLQTAAAALCLAGNSDPDSSSDTAGSVYAERAPNRLRSLVHRPQSEAVWTWQHLIKAAAIVNDEHDVDAARASMSENVAQCLTA